MRVSEINIYPIKSLKGVSLDFAVVEERGLRHDRRWLLTDRDGMFMTQREFPRMATITVEMTSDALRVTSDTTGEMRIPFEPDSGDRQSVTIWQSICNADVYRGAISEWFSDVLATGCQLVYMPDNSRRRVNERFNTGDEIVSFADGYPLMVLGEASLHDLNGRLDTPLPMNRFRPNIVVVETAPYEEDNWRQIRIGDVVFRSTKPCERCSITTVDQRKGEFDGKEPLKTLASYRMAKTVIPGRYEKLGMNATAVLFGQNLIPETPGETIQVGDKVELLQR